MDIDDNLFVEIDTLKVVVETIGANANTDGEMAVAYILASLLVRLQNEVKETVN